MLLFLPAGQVTAQTNVYDCFLYTAVTQAQIDADDAYSAGCILFEQSQTYYFDQSDNKTVTASRQIDIEPGFTATDFLPGDGMTLVLCNDLKEVASFSHSDLNTVEALKKFEFGIRLPQDIEDRIQYYINTGDSTDPVNGGINPYLDWQLNAEAHFVHRSTGFDKLVYGFYFQDFERDTSNPNINYWSWNELPTDYHLRFRYAPEKEGVWDIALKVTLGDSSVYSYCPFSINVTPNTDNDGYVKVAPNKHVLQRNGELFFPVGQNGPWPRDFGPGTGVYNGAYATAPVRAWPYKEFAETMEGYSQAGMNYFRIILQPFSLDIEFEEVGNYTSRLNYGWEIDNIVEKAEEEDLYIHFNFMLHSIFENASALAFLNWDWGNEYIAYGYPVSEGAYGYKDRFNISDTLPEAFFSDPGCKKYYKQKLRYLISRYGYSPHIALFELLSEASNVGKHYDIVNTTGAYGQDSVGLNLRYAAYEQSAEHRLNMAWWHDEMAKYIKNDLGHTEHLISVSYGHLPAPPDYSYAIPEVDVITHNRYSDIFGGKYNSYVFENNSLFNLYQKPVLHSETGPLWEVSCDNDVSYLKESWMAAFTGVAGYNMWNGYYSPHLWPRLGQIRSFIHDNAEVNELFMGDWVAGYTNDNTSAVFNAPAIRKEAVSVRGTSGSTERRRAGVISNLTDNYYTNTNLMQPTSCSQNTPQDSLQNKRDLYSNNGILMSSEGMVSDFTFDWYDNNGNYLSTGFVPLATVCIWPHPISCATDSCLLNTSEIPFVSSSEASFFGRSGFQNEANHHESSKYSHSGGNGTKSSRDGLQQDKITFEVFPNPASSSVFIMCNDPDIIEYEIIDSFGKKVGIFPRVSVTTLLNTTNLQSGIFVILGKDRSEFTKYQEKWVKL